jgi:hypothetical protein
MAIDPISMGLQVLGSGFSIFQGIQAKKEAKKAEMRARERVLKAEREVSRVETEGLQVPLEAYEIQTQSLMAAQQAALQGMRESGQRALQGGVQRLQEGVVRSSEGIRQNMAKDIYGRDVMIAKEKIDDSKSIAGINLKVAEGETAKAQDLNQMGAMQISSGVKGFLGAGAKLYEGSDLFSKRQGELAGGQKALEIQSAGGMDLGEGVTNARQARRAMQDMGYTGEQIAGLGMGIVPFTPQQMAGLQSIGF